jgi:hypothetical protein
MKKLNKDSLVAEFDIRQQMSWLGNSDDLSITSLVMQAKYNEVNLENTEYIENIQDSGVFTSLPIFEDRLTLFPVKPKDANEVNPFEVIVSDCEVAGKYFEFKGGMLTGNFSFPNTSYNILPKRYLKGFAMQVNININEETFPKIENGSDGVFMFLGARAENKYLPIGDRDDDVNGNLIAFKFNHEGRIGYKYIDDQGFIAEGYSTYSIKSYGWKLVTITYIPEGVVQPHLAHCTPRRKGELCIYVNGLPYLTISDFEEPMFKDYDNGDSTIGLPYSISLGGGSIGLSHVVKREGNGEIIEGEVAQHISNISKYFGGKFFGGIQVARIFDKHMLFDEVIGRYNQEAENYGLHKMQGGRLIYYER